MHKADDGSIILTAQDYEKAISASLSPKQIELLQFLYSCKNKSATAKQVANFLNTNTPAIIIANKQIGNLGKTIGEFLNIIPGEAYQDKEGNWKGAFFGWYWIISDGYNKQSGWKLLPKIQEALENLELVKNGFPIEERLSTETQPIEGKQLYKEGKAIQVFVNRYERNQEARTECIKEFGDKCFVCGFDFEQTYGDIAKGFIHVHHIKPLSEIQKEYTVNPKKDLVPLCPNCHSVIHLTKPEMTPNELKEKWMKNEQNKK